MRRRRQFLTLLAATALLLGIAGVSLAYVARHEPAFYQRAALDPGAVRQQLANDFERNYSDHVLNPILNGHAWSLKISQDQLNAYLQEKNGISQLFSYPENISEPRVEFDTERIRIGFRYGTGRWSAVVSVDLRTWLVAKEPNTIALELCGLKVGGMSLGSHSMMEYVTEAAREANADVVWYRNGAHPVALIRLQANQNRPTFQLNRYEFSSGHALLHGKPTAETITPPETTSAP